MARSPRRVVISASERVGMLPPYLFAELDRQKAAASGRGAELLDFGIGDPDLPTPPAVVEAAREAVADPECHRYPSGRGCGEFLDAASRWMSSQFGVETEGGLDLASVIGSKEGLAHVPLFFCNPGDVVLVPNPGYPVYRAASILAGAVPVDMPLLRENRFAPEPWKLDRRVIASARVMFVNYPNNPTGAVLDRAWMERLVDFARTEDILLVSDAAYSHVRFDGGAPASFLSLPGAPEVCLEMHSLSKTFNMTGWRVGFVAGGSRLIRTFMTAKENLDSGVFTAVQRAAASAMDGYDPSFLEAFRRRRELLTDGLRRLDWDVFESPATFYVWVALPRGTDSMKFASRLISGAGIVVTPGSGFGTYGEGYVRFALTVPEEDILKALGRLEQRELRSGRIAGWLRRDSD